MLRLEIDFQYIKDSKAVPVRALSRRHCLTLAFLVALDLLELNVLNLNVNA